MLVFEKIKNTLITTAIVYVVLGLVMFLTPVVVSDFICYIIGALFLVLGGSGIFSYIKNKGEGFASSFFLGISIISTALGIYIICNPAAFISLIPLVVGIMLIVDSINKFKTAQELKRNGYSNWWQMFLVVLITIALGIFLIFNPFKSVEIIIRFIGALLIFDGLSNLFTIYSCTKIKKR